MSCILCDSWAHCPVNPKSLHPRRRDTVIERDVEVALLTGYVWGSADACRSLCVDHVAEVAEMKKRLGMSDPETRKTLGLPELPPSTTSAEKRLAARLLEMAASVYSNHGSNDFDLVADGGMLAKEADDFRRRFHAWNGDLREYLAEKKKRTDLPDFCAMGFLAHLLDEEGRDS